MRGREGNKVCAPPSDLETGVGNPNMERGRARGAQGRAVAVQNIEIDVRRTTAARGGA